MAARTEVDDTARALARALPPAIAPAFGSTFLRSSDRYDEFVDRLALGVFRAAGLEAAVREPGRVEEVVARAGLEPQRALVPVGWLLHRLAGRGVLEEVEPAAGGRRYRIRGRLAEVDPAPLREEQARHDPAWLPSYDLAETVAHDYPAFLRGERTGEEILFSPARLRLWVSFFSNDNALYAVNNLVGAVAAVEWAPPGPLTILELGGGLGSGAAALLDRLRDRGRWPDLREYRFTELVPAFLRRGQQALQARFPEAAFLRFGALDMNRPFAAGAVAPASLSLVYAVNTLHVARDLDVTLREIFRALAPGGRLVVSECVRPAPGRTTYVEFVFNLMETFRAPVLHPVYRPNGGFLTPEQWQGALEAAGFVDVRLLPDIAGLRDRFPAFSVAAIGAARPR